MKKRKVCIGLAAAMLLQAPVFADVENVRITGNTCTISGTAEAGEYIGILITGGGETGGDINKAVAFENAYANSSGAFNISLGISEERAQGTNQLEVFVKVGDNERKSYLLDYISMSELETLINSFKNTSDYEDVADILNNPDNRLPLQSLGFDLDLWADADKDNVAKVIFANKDCFDQGVEQIEEKFNLALYLSSYASGVDLEQLTDFIDAISAVGISDIVWTEVKNDADKKAGVLEYLEKNAPYESTDSLNEEFGAASIFYDLLNVSAYGYVRDILDKYQDILKLEEQSYYSDYRSHKDDTAKNMLAILEDRKESGIESVEDFHSLMSRAVDDAMPDEDDDDNNNSRPGGGGGGGGGGLPSSPIVAPPVTTQPETGSEQESGEEEIQNQTFSDLSSGHWAFQAVEALHEMGAISGYEDGTFLPDKSVSREEFLTMLLNALEIQTIGGTCPFDDVEYGKWYSPYVSTAYLKGMISGIEQNRFGLGEEITRQDIAAILMRSRSEYPTENIRTYSGFSDDADISDYAKDAVRTMYEQGVINGSDGYFYPKNSATRAETAVMIYNFINLDIAEDGHEE